MNDNPGAVVRTRTRPSRSETAGPYTVRPFYFATPYTGRLCLSETNFQNQGGEVRGGFKNREDQKSPPQKRPKTRKITPKTRKKRQKTPKNNPEGRKKDGKKCRPFSFYTVNCEQTVNERNFQIFTKKAEKCEKIKIIFTFPLGRSCSNKIYKIFNRTLVCTKKSKKLLKCVDKRVFLC